ncbi:MAG: MFS transporter [Alphaproteobacteria bacterium]|nr:MFS transporter [Alphaproteobacteria bacterium]
MPRAVSPLGLIVLLCLCEVLTTLDAFAFASLLPDFGRLWQLSAIELGWISGIFFAGYTLAVPVLVSLTDRVDARPIYMVGAAVIACAACGFALFAEGFWTALLFRFFAGVGFAGTYMPGLRVLIDRYEGSNQSRAIAAYTACFSLGVASSYLAAGLVQTHFDWRVVFWMTGVAAAVSLLLVAIVLRPIKPVPPETTTHLLDFRPVLRNRVVMGYVLGYGVHAWELLGLRAWIVAFLVFGSQASGNGDGLAPTQAAALGAILAVIASMTGGELASRFGRRRVITIIMFVSAAMACGVGFTAGLPYGWVVAFTMVYVFAVQGESAALTTGTVQAAPKGRQGATLAVHSISGFTGGFFGPLVFGIVLDLTGRAETSTSWGYAFLSLGIAVALGPLFLIMTGDRKPRRS